jgi:hypothetical protein
MFGPHPLQIATTPEPPFDNGTEARIGTLRSQDAQGLARRHLQIARARGLDARIGNLGGARTTAGQIQAGAQTAIAATPGNSPHERGAGYDIGLFENGGPLRISDPYGLQMHQHLQEIGRSLNMTLGPPGDYGHFEITGWRQLPDLQLYTGPQL